MIFINAWEKDTTKSPIIEGGIARNTAYACWLRKNKLDLKEIKQRRFRVLFILEVILILFYSKNQSILFMYPSVGVPIHNCSVLGRFFSLVFLRCLSRAKDRNKLIFDISDLKYEQSIDLELVRKNIDFIKRFEFRFFTLKGVRFIFASGSMRDYAVNKYGIDLLNTDIAINGGPETDSSNGRLEIPLDKESINFVYAGTMNRGRSIERMISGFPKDNKHHLYLAGIGGEWVSPGANVHYLGAIEEEALHRFVSNCDIGLIPYDNNRLYYNLAYPTKLSFYLTAGISFLSTPFSEAKSVHDKYGMGFLYDFDKWDNLCASIDKTKLYKDKLIVQDVKCQFSWGNILDSCDTLKVI